MKSDRSNYKQHADAAFRKYMAYLSAGNANAADRAYAVYVAYDRLHRRGQENRDAK